VLRTSSVLANSKSGGKCRGCRQPVRVAAPDAAPVRKAASPSRKVMPRNAPVQRMPPQERLSSNGRRCGGRLNDMMHKYRRGVNSCAQAGMRHGVYLRFHGPDGRGSGRKPACAVARESMQRGRRGRQAVKCLWSNARVRARSHKGVPYHVPALSSRYAQISTEGSEAVHRRVLGCPARRTRGSHKRMSVRWLPAVTKLALQR